MGPRLKPLRFPLARCLAIRSALGMMLLTGAIGVPTTVQAVRPSTSSPPTTSQATRGQELYASLPLRFARATQLPCRAVVELE